MKSFFIALQFLSRIHVVTQTVWTEADFGRSVIFFPLVGTIIGAVLCLAYAGVSLWFSQPYAAVLLVLCWLFVTGGLHADGLMDTADGLFSGRSRERMLEILKDSCVGSNGVVAFVSCTALKICFLANLPQQAVCAVLLAVPTAARFGVLIGIFQFPYARTAGLGAGLRPICAPPRPGQSLPVGLAAAGCRRLGLLPAVRRGDADFAGIEYVYRPAAGRRDG